MRRMIIAFAFLFVIVCLAIAYHLFVKPVLGGILTPQLIARYSKSAQWHKKGFVNQNPTTMDLQAKHIPRMLKNWLLPKKNSRPATDIQVVKIDPKTIGALPVNGTRVTWFGHSAVMLEIGGGCVLLDPMFGAVPAPFDFLGRNRYNKQQPLEVADFAEIDVLLMSHDHYDHLDYGTICTLKHKVKKFVVTLGVARHLEAWGVSPLQIHELDWGDEIQIGLVKFTCAPARHFSGRGFTDRSKSLWSSWVIASGETRIYFGADSGYGPHFKQIAEAYGPFDLAFIECGQYNELWQAIHMLPAQSAQAALDIGALVTMPIHWGAFTLAFHSWTEPIEEFVKHATRLKVNFTTPEIGEQFVIGPPRKSGDQSDGAILDPGVVPGAGNVSYPSQQWWKKYD